MTSSDNDEHIVNRTRNNNSIEGTKCLACESLFECVYGYFFFVFSRMKWEFHTDDDIIDDDDEGRSYGILFIGFRSMMKETWQGIIDWQNLKKKKLFSSVI